jgi:carotenoid cleavage dioxygenase-like enzyme
VDTQAATFAHPHINADGSWITMGRNTRSKIPYYQFLRYKAGTSVSAATVMAEQAEVIGKIPSSHKNGLAYFHSFGLTENYIIYFETAVKIDIGRIFGNILFNRPTVEAVVVDRTFETRIHLMNKTTGELVKQKFVTEPMFLFHHINAYEKPESGEIIVDVCAYNAKTFDLKKLKPVDLFTGNLEGTDAFKSIARRVTIPLKSAESEKPIHCGIKDINELPFELPIINYGANNCKPYKYAYGTNVAKSPYSIIKLNVDDGKAIEIEYDTEMGAKCLPTEPIFVPNPSGTDEDDGVLLVQVLCDKNDFLSVLSAKDLKEIARASVPEGVQGSWTFHGFFADTQTFPKLNA